LSLIAVLHKCEHVGLGCCLFWFVCGQHIVTLLAVCGAVKSRLMHMWTDESFRALLVGVRWMGLDELRCLMRVICDCQTMPPMYQAS
jgi:hypothetical protein